MTTPLQPNYTQKAFAVLGLEKVALCAYEPRKLLILKDNVSQGNQRTPSKPAQIPAKTDKKAVNPEAEPKRGHPRIALSDSDNDGGPIAPKTDYKTHPFRKTLIYVKVHFLRTGFSACG
jgi:hypothetical protein